MYNACIVTGVYLKLASSEVFLLFVCIVTGVYLKLASSEVFLLFVCTSAVQ